MPSYVDITKEPARAARYLTQGRLVAFPTGTSYGLAADALQGFALRRLRTLKRRPDGKSLTIFLDPGRFGEYLDLTDTEEKLLAAAVSQPLTLLVKPQESLRHLAQDNLVGLRLIDHPLMAKLAKAAARPLTATSANISGEQPCRDAACIQQQFPGRVDETTYDLSLAAILDGGALPPAPPTTIAKIEDGEVKIIRQGQLTAADIQKFFD